ncbi:WhiB family transcriptional regulator [Streptomyces sp. NPDC056580]|uniref:WhiB family transcriptional regulator n=1 Tax=Streptomyces sp. NPDC056580 TaxID=3345872 RepID=UPI00367EC4F7
MAKPVIICLIFSKPLPELRRCTHRGDDSPCPQAAGKGFVVTCTPSGDQARSDWRDRAACVGEDPEIFFPLSDLIAPGAEASLARAICRRCPVITDCRTWALDHGEDDGIWGATTAAQRRAIRRAITEPVRTTGRSRDERGEAASQQSTPCYGRPHRAG